MSLQLPILSISILLLLIIVFFTKKRVNSYETKIYGVLLIMSFFNVLFFILAYILSYINAPDHWILLINRLDLPMYCFWSSAQFLYVFYITFKNDEKKDFSKVIKGIIIANSIIFIISLFLPIEIFWNGTDGYATGLCVLFVYGICGVYLLSSLALALYSVIKRIEIVKNIPILSLIVLMILAAVYQSMVPNLLIIPPIIVFMELLMFFTIENPDVKMINQLELAKTQAEKANHAKSDFLSSMSHEIRTPLNAIVGLSEYIKDKENVPEDIKPDLQDIVNASNTLLDIVGNILDINKIENDKLEITNVPYNFKEELVKIAKLNKSRVHDKGLTLNITVAKDIPYELIGDKVHVKSIINNLLTNAAKYTDKGEINVNVNCINKDNICTLIISVRDTGRGIKAENINKLFQKFERLDAEKNSTTEGTGLGLAITKRVVELMNGKINVESQYGQGSLFIVHLPQTISKMENDNPVNEEIKVVEKNNSNKNILIVDDSKINIKVAKKLLEKEKYNIDEAYDGEECLKILKNNKYDLILMDIMMPLQSGDEVLKILKKDKNFNTPVIALTADAVAGAEKKYLEQGFIDYLAKPFNKEQIIKILEDILKD